MDINTIATFLLNNLFNQVALLVGIFVAIGLLAQGKGARLTIEGTIRAALGYVILGVGIDVFIGGLIAFQNVVGAAFGITPPTSTNTLSGFLQTSGSAVALIMAGGYLVHLILGRILRTKFVYLTGHLMYWISVVIAVSVYQSVPGASAAQVALFGSLVAGVYWTIQPALLQRFMKKITGNNDVGFAHTSSLACYLASILGKYVGDPKKENTESIKLPGWLSVFKDINVSTSLVISLILLASAAAVVAGPADDAVVTGALVNCGDALVLCDMAQLAPQATGVTNSLAACLSGITWVTGVSWLKLTEVLGVAKPEVPKTLKIEEVAIYAVNLDKLPPGMEPGLFAFGVSSVSVENFPNGCHVCEVEVDPQTGVVRIDRFTAVDDFGTIINPMIVEGQVHGGLVQGLGQALMENCVYDKQSGQLLTGSFMDYAMPRADDFPTFNIGHVCTPCTHNPLGTKGCGEAGAIGSPPALMNAVLDALSAVGVKDLDMPASPNRVWQAIQSARH